MKLSRGKIGKPGYYVFGVMVVGLFISSFIRVECPICHGTGILNATPGMEYVTVLSKNSELKSVIVNGCDMYLMYEYQIGLKVQNSKLTSVSGWIKTKLWDIDTNILLDTKYVPLNVPSALNPDVPYVMDVFYTIWYQTTLEEEQHVEVQVEILKEDVPDATCGGSGKIRLNTFPLVRMLKESFQKAGNIEVPYQPPSWFVPSYE
jgi:hypothetical protein